MLKPRKDRGTVNHGWESGSSGSLIYSDRVCLWAWADHVFRCIQYGIDAADWLVVRRRDEELQGKESIAVSDRGKRRVHLV